MYMNEIVVLGVIPTWQHNSLQWCNESPYLTLVLESGAQTGEAAALCSQATRSTGGSDIGQSPRLLLLKVVCLV